MLTPVQSHGGQVRHLAGIPRWCDGVTDSANPARFARRPLLKAAVLGLRDKSDFSVFASRDRNADTGLVYAVTGTIVDVSPHVLVLGTGRGEQRFPLAASARAWRGSQVSPAALRQGDHVLAKRGLPGGPVLDRIWAQAGRATGTIIERDGPATLLGDR